MIGSKPAPKAEKAKTAESTTSKPESKTSKPQNRGSRVRQMKAQSSL